MFLSSDYIIWNKFSADSNFSSRIPRYIDVESFVMEFENGFAPSILQAEGALFCRF